MAIPPLVCNFWNLRYELLLWRSFEFFLIPFLHDILVYRVIIRSLHDCTLVLKLTDFFIQCLAIVQNSFKLLFAFALFALWICHCIYLFIVFYFLDMNKNFAGSLLSNPTNSSSTLEGCKSTLHFLIAGTLLKPAIGLNFRDLLLPEWAGFIMSFFIFLIKFSVIILFVCLNFFS